MLSQEATNLLMRHPGLVIVETDDGILLRGLIKSKGKRYHISISCPNFPALKNFKMLVRHGFMVNQFTENALGSNNWTLNELINNLEVISELNTDNAAARENFENNSNIETGENFYAEIAALHNPELYDIKLNLSCTLICFCKFSINEQHFLEIELPSLNVRNHSLPDCLELPDLLSKCQSLTDRVEKFLKIVNELQPFYENLFAIDELCHVLQPAKPTTKHNYRLFVLRERVFLKLVIADPFALFASMSLHIIGPTAEVDQLRRVYSEGLKNWDADLDIQNNLLRIFDLCYFPMPPLDNTEEHNDTFCNICYSYRLLPADDEGVEMCDVPIVSCDNPHCSLLFHDTCLLKWFRTLSDNVAFLSVSFGDCPFCKAKLSTSFEQLRLN